MIFTSKLFFLGNLESNQELVALWSLFGYTDLEPFCERSFGMISNPIIFAGVELSSGHKPLTVVGLDEDLDVKLRGAWNVLEALFCLQEYEKSFLAINVPFSKREQELYTDFQAELIRVGFTPFSQRTNSNQWLVTNAQDSFHALGGHKLLPRRTLEGRLQRAAILYEQGLQIMDPVDLFEEITRYKLIQGILPLENLPSSKELDALVAAYVAWMSLNRPGRIVPTGDLVLPAQE